MWTEEHNMHHAYTLRPHADPQFTYFPLWLQTEKEVPKWREALPSHPVARSAVWGLTRALNRVQVTHTLWNRSPSVLGNPRTAHILPLTLPAHISDSISRSISRSHLPLTPAFPILYSAAPHVAAARRWHRPFQFPRHRVGSRPQAP